MTSNAVMKPHITVEKSTEDGDVEADEEGSKYPYKWFKVSPAH